MNRRNKYSCRYCGHLDIIIALDGLVVWWIVDVCLKGKLYWKYMALNKFLHTFPLWFPNNLVHCTVKDREIRWRTYFACQCTRTLIVLFICLFNNNVIIRPRKPSKVPSIRTRNVKIVQPTQKNGMVVALGLLGLNICYTFETTCLLTTSKDMSIYFMSKLLEAIQNFISLV